MFRRLGIAAAAVALLTPAAALAATPAKAAKLKAGQHCAMSKESYYKTHGFTCVKGHLQAMKKK